MINDKNVDWIEVIGEESITTTTTDTPTAYFWPLKNHDKITLNEFKWKYNSVYKSPEYKTLLNKLKEGNVASLQPNSES